MSACWAENSGNPSTVIGFAFSLLPTRLTYIKGRHPATCYREAKGNRLKTLRVGVVGAGSFGRNHLRILRELPGVKLAAVMDLNSDVASAAVAEYDTVACFDLSQFCHSVDAAIIASPTVSHADVGCQLLS